MMRSAITSGARKGISRTYETYASVLESFMRISPATYGQSSPSHSQRFKPGPLHSWPLRVFALGILASVGSYVKGLHARPIEIDSRR